MAEVSRKKFTTAADILVILTFYMLNIFFKKHECLFAFSSFLHNELVQFVEVHLHRSWGPSYPTV